MSEISRWHVIRTDSHNLPRLLLKTTFEHDGYSIDLTDLSRVWSQALRKDDILAQARHHRCSIDPSEDDQQYGILLDKIRTALTQEDGTSLSLTTTKDDKIKLDLSAPLPAPLPELEWTITLERAPAECIEIDLVLPLLQQADNLKHQMQRLIAELHAKDKVISKITDRLETSGHDLTVVFPGVSGVKLSRKMSQQEQLARHVRGLGSFDEKAWNRRFAEMESHDSMSIDAMDEVLAALPPASNGLGKPGVHGDWWRALSAGQTIALNGTVKLRADEIATHEGFEASTDGEDEDGPSAGREEDFQRQTTPPHLRHGASTTQPKEPSVPPQRHTQPHPQSNELPADEDAMDDEDDLDGPSQHSQTSRPPIAAAASPSPQFPEPSKAFPATKAPQSNKSPRKPIFEEGDETEDEDDLDGPSQPLQKAAKLPESTAPQMSLTPATSPSPPSKAPGKKLGTFGGRARKSMSSRDSTPSAGEPTQSVTTDTAPKPKTRAKLGTFGGKPKRQPTPEPPPTDPSATSPSPAKAKKMGILGGKRTAPQDSSPSVPASPDPSNGASARPSRPVEQQSPPAARETSEERANRKRTLLKRQLEEKAKAPVKKKRKF